MNSYDELLDAFEGFGVSLAMNSARTWLTCTKTVDPVLAKLATPLKDKIETGTYEYILLHRRDLSVGKVFSNKKYHMSIKD